MSTLFAVTLVAALAVPALASGAGGTAAFKAQRKAKILKKFDADGDGTLNPQERAKAKRFRKAKKAKRLRRYDADGNGAIDASERAKIQADRQARRAKRMQKYDLDGNGTIDANERGQLQADRQARRTKRMRRFDTNRNGTIDRSERLAMRRARRSQRLNKRYDKLIIKLDSNKDGRLSVAEMEAAPRFQGNKAKPRKRQRMKRRFAMADTNADGVITRGEFRKAGLKRKAAKHRRKARRNSPTP